MKQLIPLGVLIIFIGMILVIIGALSQAGKTDSKVAVGGFIGFIPFGFANDKRMLYFVIGLSALMIILWFVLSNWR